jgi:hypothetical protein
MNQNPYGPQHPHQPQVVYVQPQKSYAWLVVLGIIAMVVMSPFAACVACTAIGAVSSAAKASP